MQWTHPQIKKPAKQLCLLLKLGCCLLLLAPVCWANEEPQHAQLERLREEIRDLKHSIHQSKSKKVHVQEQIRLTEKGISKLNHLLLKLKSKQKDLQKQLPQLKSRQTALEFELQSHRKAIKHQIRSNYALGRQPYIKLLLSQKNPQTVARALNYFDRYNRARLKKIQSTQDHLAELKHTRKQIQSKSEQVKHIKKERIAEKQQLADLRLLRAKTLVALNLQLDSKQQKLNLLLENEQYLANLVQSIGSGKGLANTKPRQHRPFTASKGQLSWPVKGRISAGFGSARNIGDLKWQGILISAPSGQVVRAVSHGRVAYADWLRGFGLLMILDHGNGYMSLYGRNESLYKETGSWVETNEVIATVGASGGQQKSGLYFEVRHNGKPVNPVKWLDSGPNR